MKTIFLIVMLSVSANAEVVRSVGSLIYKDNVNSRVGINTLTPAYTLDVNGQINASGGMLMSGPLVATTATFNNAIIGVLPNVSTISYLGVISAPSLIIGSDSVSGMDVSIYGGTNVSGDADYRTTSLGFKALGKTAYGRIYSSLNSLLFLNNMDYHGTTYISNRDDISLNSAMLEMGQDGFSFWFVPSGANPINAGGADFATLGNAYHRMNNERAYWMNAKIGISTISPTAALDVKGASSAGVDATNKGIFRVIGSDGVGLAITEINAGGYGMSLQAVDNRPTSSDFYNIHINPQGGNVGVGTTNPATTLDVNGTFSVGGSTLAVRKGILVVGEPTLGAGGLETYPGYIGQFYSPASQTFLWIGNNQTGADLTDGLVIGNDVANSYIIQNENLPLTFWTNATQKATILGNGNVGIGTTAPTSSLMVKAAAGMNYSLMLTSSTDAQSFGVHPDGHLSIYGSSTTIATCTNGGLVATARDTAGTIAFTGANSSCAITFGSVFDAAPVCVVSGATANAMEGAILSAISVDGFTVIPNTGAWENGDKVNYICVGGH